MGLDMYLFRADKGILITDDESRWPELPEVAYWRKANAIHNYFVQKFQGGVDECQLSNPITLADLIELREICVKMVNTCDARRLLPSDSAKECEMVDLALQLLPPVGGFFFGGTDVDDYYFGDLRDTVEMINAIEREHTEGDTYFYQSSW